jgi:hypothetical protein
MEAHPTTLSVETVLKHFGPIFDHRNWDSLKEIVGYVMTTDELLKALQEASDDYRKAVHATTEILRDTPSGIPYPDGTFRILQASRIQKTAHDRYLAALISFNEAAKNPK